jgi:hypothetical protein
MTGYQSKKAAAQDKLDDDDIQVYKRPWVLQREWVDLTDEEIDKWTPEIHGVIHEVIAQFKEKNNA